MADDNFVVGIDEVGRGSLAGPVVAAAVILNGPINGLMDSKKLTRIKRNELDKIIRRKARSFGIGWTNIEDINKHGLTYAVSNAMQIALSAINVKYDSVIIDGNYNFLPGEGSVSLVVKGDESVPSISAASIIAKVYRDDWMSRLSKEFPEYGFEQNVGYGTKKHLEMLELYGPCDIHRMFYKPLLRFNT